MNRIRVLIVDTVSSTRQDLTRILSRNRQIDIVGATSNTRLALSHVNEKSPDVVILGLATPNRDELKVLKCIRETHPQLPVIMFSTLTERGSQETLDSLMLGASDYVTKPVTEAGLETCVSGELTRKIETLGLATKISTPRQMVSGSASHGATTIPTTSPSAIAQSMSSTPRKRSSVNAEIVAIAASTGGPDALATLLSSLPTSFVTPIVIVQHMTAGFTASLAESLTRLTRRIVREAVSTQPLESGAIWIAPAGRHLRVAIHDGSIQVCPFPGPPENDCRPSADVLFRSVANIFKSNCLAVVLTGMGSDGLAGCREIYEAGGTVIVQDESSSVVWGMPGHVAAAGLASAILPLSQLSQEICRYATRKRTTSTDESLPRT